jgi:hypothetical protein
MCGGEGQGGNYYLPTVDILKARSINLIRNRQKTCALATAPDPTEFRPFSCRKALCWSATRKKGTLLTHSNRRRAPVIPGTLLTRLGTLLTRLAVIQGTLLTNLIVKI